MRPSYLPKPSRLMLPIFRAALSIAGLFFFHYAAFAARPDNDLAKADTRFEDAEMSRTSLDELPSSQRTLKAYNKVVDSYRRIYLDAPSSQKATVSLMRIADLYQAMASDLKSDKYLDQAVKTYDFLLKEYPYSQNRPLALLTSAQILQNSLGQPEEAKKRIEALRKRYPKSEESKESMELLTANGKPVRVAPPPLQPATPVATAAPETMNALPMTPDAGIEPAVKPAAVPPAAAESKPAESKPGDGPVEITGVREVKTTDSTRIIVDLGGEVKYEIGTAESPRRVYLDLQGARIGRDAIKELSQRPSDASAPVKALRAGQFQPAVARVVAEISPDAKFSVFDLTNPYRLVIDLKTPAAAPNPPAAKNNAPAADFSAPAKPLSVAAAPPDSKPAAKASAPTNSIVEAAVKTKPEAKASPDVKSAEATATPKIPVVVKPVVRVPDTPSVTASDAASSRAKDNGIIETASAAIKPSPASNTNSEAKSLAMKEPLPAPAIPATKDSAKAEPSIAVSEKKQVEPAPVRVADNKTSPAPVSKPEPPAAKPSLPMNDDAVQYRAALPSRNGNRSLTRALGLKVGRIILDAGHGGHDKGTVGPAGLMEKDLVLDVTMRLGKLLSERLGSEVIYTRESDLFVPLEARTDIANEKKADLFLSIHANSSPAKSAKGIETYYLSFTSDPEALEIATRENALAQESVHQLEDIVKQIALHDKVDESREFASEVQNALYAKLGKDLRKRKDRGVKKAPFVVLVGAQMPSVLAEIAFLSNPQEEKLLKTKAQRQKIAEALYSGTAKYMESLSGLRVAKASGIDKGASKLAMQ